MTTKKNIQSIELDETYTALEQLNVVFTTIGFFSEANQKDEALIMAGLGTDLLIKISEDLDKIEKTLKGK